MNLVGGIIEIIQTDARTQFTSKEFQEGLSVRLVRLVLAAPEHQETNGTFEVTWQTMALIFADQSASTMTSRCAHTTNF